MKTEAEIKSQIRGLEDSLKLKKEKLKETKEEIIKLEKLIYGIESQIDVFKWIIEQEEVRGK